MSIVFFFCVLMTSAYIITVLSKHFFDAPFIFAIHILVLMGIPPLLQALGFEPANKIFHINNPGNVNIKLALILCLFVFGVTIGALGFRRTNLGQLILPDYKYARSDGMFLIGISVLTFCSFLVVLFPLRDANFNIIQAIANVRFEGYFFSGLNVFRQFVFFAAILSGGFFVYLSKLKYERVREISNTVIYYIVILFILNIIFSLILGGKSFVIFPLFGTLLAYILCRSKINYTALGLCGLTLLIVIVGLQFFRTKVVTDMHVSHGETVYNGLYFIIYDTTLAYLEADEEFLDTKLGEDFGNSFIAIIPRFLWPEKPTSQISAGNRFAHALQPHKDNPGGRPPYGMAQWYVNFGWIGVIFGGVLTGWILTILQEKYSDFRQNPFSFIIMWHFIFMVLGPWPGGIHNTSLMNYILYILPLFIFKWLTHKKLYDLPAHN